MTDVCTIGPVSITDPHLFEENTFSFSNSAVRTVASGSSIISRGQFNEEYGFQVITTFDEALQLKGVVEMGEIIWLNTNSDLTNNNYFQHKGWVILTELNVEHINPGYTKCSIKYIKVSDHENEYLTMDYSRGIYDGINLDPNYTITSTVYDLQEDGSDATTNFTTIQEWPTTATTAWATDGAEWDLDVASGADGTWAYGWARVDTMTFTPPFTLDTAFDYNSLPGAAAYPACMGILITPHLIASGSDEIHYKRLGDYLELQWGLSNTATSLQIAYVGTGGAATLMKSGTSMGTADADIGIRLQMEADGKIRVYYDDDATLASPTQWYYGPSNLKNYKNGLYVYLYAKNRDSTSLKFSWHFLNIYNSDDATFPNIVCMPYNSTQVTAATGHRHGEDGDIYYYTDPTTELRFTVAKADYYKGSVKLLSTNNSASASRQVFGTDIKLTPTTTTLKNAFTQLTFDADEVIISGYDGGWQEVNRIHFTADIDFIRPLFISSERVVLQINSTKWTMLRSSPIVTVEHPNEILEYTLRDRYNLASGLISAPGAAANIDMTADTDYYCPIYNNASDTYQLLIVLKDEAIIKSDSIPVASSPVGIGWFKKGNTGIDAAASLAQQWYKQTRTGISLKQII